MRVDSKHLLVYRKLKMFKCKRNVGNIYKFGGARRWRLGVLPVEGLSQVHVSTVKRISSGRPNRRLLVTTVSFITIAIILYTHIQNHPGSGSCELLSECAEKHKGSWLDAKSNKKTFRDK